jgi:hypothetical protein
VVNFKISMGVNKVRGPYLSDLEGMLVDLCRLAEMLDGEKEEPEMSYQDEGSTRGHTSIIISLRRLSESSLDVLTESQEGRDHSLTRSFRSRPRSWRRWPACVCAE